MVAIMTMSTNLATPGVSEMNVFRNKGFDVIILFMMPPTKFSHVTQIIL